VPPRLGLRRPATSRLHAAVAGIIAGFLTLSPCNWLSESRRLASRSIQHLEFQELRLSGQLKLRLNHLDEEEFRIKASRYDTSAGPSTSCMADERSTAASSVSRSKDAYAEKTFKSPDELPGEYLKYHNGIHSTTCNRFSTTNSEMASRRLSHVVKDNNKGGAAKRKVNAEARSN